MPGPGRAALDLGPRGALGNGLTFAGARLMDHFLYRDGVLHAEDVPLPAIAEAVGTPVYVYASAIAGSGTSSACSTPSR